MTGFRISPGWESNTFHSSEKVLRATFVIPNPMPSTRSNCGYYFKNFHLSRIIFLEFHLATPLFLCYLQAELFSN